MIVWALQSQRWHWIQSIEQIEKKRKQRKTEKLSFLEE